jgi:hypothetical protein
MGIACGIMGFREQSQGCFFSHPRNPGQPAESAKMYCTITVKRHFYAREKIMRMGQNGPLDKFTPFLFMRQNVPCVAMYGAMKIYARQFYVTAA